ncbi:histone deacetylase [Actinoplanes sp. DH11]|uniref:histone deacetylase n=1 Tax=Actinoplanes sp. DH11 TaxID=2857011 RepID=UPI001E4B8A93|nr:histone deacetylase [Actinoplanes sp. DH11]
MNDFDVTAGGAEPDAADLLRSSDVMVRRGEARPVPMTVSAPADACELVWYAAYGSNLYAARLRYYLAGGRPPGARRVLPGCRDASEPLATAPVMLPGGIYFALESSQWAGGMAMYDPQLPGTVAARAYLMTAGQFADVVAQEMYREPGVDLDVLDDVVRHGRVQLGPGRYETLVCAGARDGHPIFTFTAPWSAAEVTPNAPAAAYLRMLVGGLHESHRWDREQIASYLHARPGVAGAWTMAELLALADELTGT